MARKLLSFVVLVLALAFVAGACSDDDSETDAKDKTTTTEKSEESTTTTETPALRPDEIDSQASPYCAAWAEIRAAGAPPSNDPESVKRHYAGLVPTVEKLLNAAPAAIKASVQVALDSTRTVAASGSLDDFSRPEVQEAQGKLTDYAYKNCRK